VERGFVNAKALDGVLAPAVAVVDAASTLAVAAVLAPPNPENGVLLGVLKLNGFVSGLMVVFEPNGLDVALDANGFEVAPNPVEAPLPNVNAGLLALAGLSSFFSSTLFFAATSNIFGVDPSGMGEGVGVASGTDASVELYAGVGFLGEGGITGGVAAGVTRGASFEPNIVDLGGIVRVGFDSAGGLEAPNVNGEDVEDVELEAPNENVDLDSVGFFSTDFFESSYSFTIFSLNS
jgi:hypothetical protein